MTIRFGTDGWRGIMAEEFTFERVRRVAQAIADYFKATHQLSVQPLIVVGYDSRFMSERFARAVAEIFVVNNIQVSLVNRDTPTPVVAFSVKHLNAFGAVMITASHNPAEYNGIKFIPHYAGPATAEITDQLTENIQKLEKSGWSFKGGINLDRSKLFSLFDPQRTYIEHVKSLVSLEAIRAVRLKVLYNPFYAVGRGYLDLILKDSAELEVVNGERDPLFGGGLPEPGEENLKDLKPKILQGKFGVALASDGDADRLGLLDDEGNYVSPNEVLCLLLRHLVKNRKMTGAVIRTVATTHLLDQMAKNYNIPSKEVPVGFKYIAQEMLSSDVLIGGEESGGLSFKGHIPEKDGILAGLLVLEMMAFEKKPLSQIRKELLRELGSDFYTHRLDVRLEGSRKDSLMKAFAEPRNGTFAGSHILKIKRMDGIGYMLANGGWVLVRPSGTEPLLRIYLEARSADRLKELEMEVNRLISETV